MNTAFFILGGLIAALFGVELIGRAMRWGEPAPDEHDEHFREITRRHVRTARRRFEQYEMN